MTGKIGGLVLPPPLSNDALGFLVEEYQKVKDEAEKKYYYNLIFRGSLNIVAQQALKMSYKQTAVVGVEDLFQSGTLAIKGVIENYNPALSNSYEAYLKIAVRRTMQDELELASNRNHKYVTKMIDGKIINVTDLIKSNFNTERAVTNVILKELLRSVLQDNKAQLNDRELFCVEARFGLGTKQKMMRSEVAKIFNVSAKTVLEYLVNATEKLNFYFENGYPRPTEKEKEIINFLQDYKIYKVCRHEYRKKLEFIINTKSVALTDLQIQFLEEYYGLNGKSEVASKTVLIQKLGKKKSAGNYFFKQILADIAIGLKLPHFSSKALRDNISKNKQRLLIRQANISKKQNNLERNLKIVKQVFERFTIDEINYNLNSKYRLDLISYKYGINGKDKIESHKEISKLINIDKSQFAKQHRSAIAVFKTMLEKGSKPNIHKQNQEIIDKLLIVHSYNEFCKLIGSSRQVQVLEYKHGLNGKPVITSSQKIEEQLGGINIANQLYKRATKTLNKIISQNPEKYGTADNNQCKTAVLPPVQNK